MTDESRIDVADDGLATDEQLARLDARISGWLARQLEENPILDAVERGEPGTHRWYVRLRGEEKDRTTIWFTLRQRSLHFEAYVIPAPEENEAAFYEYFLRRNVQLYGMAFAIGDESAVYLVGAVPVGAVDAAVLDRVVGSVWAYVEQSFGAALRIGFTRRFRATTSA